MEPKDVIAAGRKRLGLTHQAFADKVGVSRGAVQQWEKGTTAPTRKNQPDVARVLNITVAELMCVSGPGVGSVSNLTAAANQASPGNALADALRVIDEALRPLDTQARRIAVGMLAGLESPGHAPLVASMLFAAIESSSSKRWAA